MVKLFSHNNHRELESVINSWIEQHINDICIIDIKYVVANIDDTTLYSTLIFYTYTHDNNISNHKEIIHVEEF